MTDADVAKYLREHPEFFDAHVDILAQIQIPDPHEGRAIPISERQLSQLRQRNRILEAKLAELITFGEENDGISERMHRITLTLISAPSLDDVLGTLYFHLREDFSVPHVALRVWGLENPPARDEFSAVSDEMQAFVTSLTVPYCTSHAMFDSLQWFPAAQPTLHSFAYIKLTNEKLGGLIVLASEDAERFYPEMGTLYLQRLGDITSATIARQLDWPTG
ncbi:MAG: DUF484 family protein [Betaproteobacteria bacterium]|jgi:uncharacterized protein YigA (DUF484 family)|nr:MAG: DUF484 family protein [Betaproteobacteria bacterium]